MRNLTEYIIQCFGKLLDVTVWRAIYNSNDVYDIFEIIFRNKHLIYSCTLVNSVSSVYEISFDMFSETPPPFWLLLVIPIWLYPSMPYASMLDGFSHVSVSQITENLWSRFSMWDSNEERLAGTLLMLRWNRESDCWKYLSDSHSYWKFALFGSCMLPVSYVSVD